MKNSQKESSDYSCITHLPADIDYKKALALLEDKILARGDLPHATMEQQLEILSELSSFELGRFLIVHRGLNGYWTDYILKYPQNGRSAGLNSSNEPFSKSEIFLLDQAPTVLATQQRFLIFKEELQKRLREGISIASIPCGVMSDLLDLDVNKCKTFKFIGCDVDPYSIKEASTKACALGLSDKTDFIQADAWNLNVDEKVDIITSNGLNIYEPSDQRLLDLYKKFFDLLSEDGVLITSFLTKPPGNPDTEWNLSSMDVDHIKKQKLIFSDILGVSWQAFRSSAETKNLLEKAGFKNIHFIYDHFHIFPTVIAQKVSVK
jgi:ubiquinone/menaquinone biosynthesis C-methylase UbiE